VRFLGRWIASSRAADIVAGGATLLDWEASIGKSPSGAATTVHG